MSEPEKHYRLGLQAQKIIEGMRKAMNLSLDKKDGSYAAYRHCLELLKRAGIIKNYYASSVEFYGIEVFDPAKHSEPAAPETEVFEWQMAVVGTNAGGERDVWYCLVEGSVYDANEGVLYDKAYAKAEEAGFDPLAILEIRDPAGPPLINAFDWSSLRDT